MFIRYNFKVIRYIYATWVGSGRVSGCLISGHSCSDRVGFRVIWSRVILGFWVVRVRIGSGCLILGHLGSSRVSGRSGSGRVRFGSVWLSEKIRSDRVRIWTGRTDFSGRIEFCHLWLKIEACSICYLILQKLLLLTVLFKFHYWRMLFFTIHTYRYTSNCWKWNANIVA
jgi:hypothetical protein